MEKIFKSNFLSEHIGLTKGKICTVNHFLIFIMISWFFCLSGLLASEKHPLAAAYTISPRDTLKYFIDEMNDLDKIRNKSGYKTRRADENFSEVVRCLDLSKTPPSLVGAVGHETVILLKEIFDRIELPPFDQIPDADEVQEEGLTRWTIPFTEIKIVKVQKGEREGDFLFSAGTVARAKTFFKTVQHLPYKPGASIDAYEDYLYGAGPMIPQSLFQHFPEWLMEPFLEQAAWQWIGLLLSIGIGSLIVLTVFYWTRSRYKTEQETLLNRLCRKLLGPLVLMIMIQIGGEFVSEQINITGTVNVVCETVLSVIFVLAAGWSITIFLNGLTDALISPHRKRKNDIDPNVVRVLSRLILFALLIILFGFAADYLGLPVSAAFASAGIVGIAVAFAARETLSNIIGGISIIFDRPFKSGDFIVLESGERGEVLEVGPWSTRILTLDDILISIPNSVITNTKIINESEPHPRFRIRIPVGVSYGTKTDHVEKVLLRLAKNNPLVTSNPEPKVRFRGFGDSALNFELFCWGRHPRDRNRLINELNKNIYSAFDEAGIKIPFPQRDIHMISQTDNDKNAKKS